MGPWGASKCLQEAPALPRLPLAFSPGSKLTRRKKPLFWGQLTYRTILAGVRSRRKFWQFALPLEAHCVVSMCNFSVKNKIFCRILLSSDKNAFQDGIQKIAIATVRYFNRISPCISPCFLGLFLNSLTDMQGWKLHFFASIALKYPES